MNLPRNKSQRSVNTPVREMNIRTTKITLVIGTLLVAFVSSLLLFHPWHRAVIDGRTFSGLFGTAITFLPLVREIPFVWPFLVAGFLLGRLPGHSLGWAFGLGVLGAILELAIVRVEFANGLFKEMHEVLRDCS